MHSTGNNHRTAFPPTRLLVTLLLATAALSVTACADDSSKPAAAARTAYYLDPAGNDSADGKSETTAWQTIDRLNQHSMAPGDQILFKRGATFTGGVKITVSGTEAAPISLGAYGSGDAPVLSGSVAATGWTSFSSNIYSKTVNYTPGSTGAGVVLENGQPLTFMSWNTDATTSLGASNGVFTFDPGDLNSSTIYIRCTAAANPATKTIETGHHLIGIHGESVSWIEIENLHLKNYSLHGIAFKHSTRITVRNCKVGNLGGAALAVSPDIILAGNGIEFTGNSSDCAVYDSQAVNIFDSGFSPQVFATGHSLSNVRYENCRAEKCGFAGFEISVLSYNSSSGESLSNVTISKCESTLCGSGWSDRRNGNEGHGIRVKADTGAGTLSSITIEQTTVSNAAGSGLYIAGETNTVTVNRCLFSGNNTSDTAADGGIICKEDNSVISLKLQMTSSIIRENKKYGLFFDVLGGKGLNLVNNTFYNNIYSSNPSFDFYNNNITGEFVLINNIFFNDNTSCVQLYVATNPSPRQISNNYFYEHGANIIGWNGTAYTTALNFHTTTSLNTNGGAGNPLFISASDLHLQAGSHCAAAGITSGVSTDYEGSTYGNPPAMGAYR